MLLPLLLAMALAPPKPAVRQPYPVDPFAGKDMILETDNTGKAVWAVLKPDDPLRKKIDAALARALEWPNDAPAPSCGYHRDVLLRPAGARRELGICFGCNLANWAPKGTSVQIRAASTVGSVAKGRDDLIYLFREALGVQKIPLNPTKNPAPRGGINH